MRIGLAAALAAHSDAVAAAQPTAAVAVRMDEGALEFVVEHKPSSTAAENAPPRLHLRVHTRSDFNLWREALGPIIANTTLQSSASTSAGSKPSAVHAAQKWLAHAEDGAARCS